MKKQIFVIGWVVAIAIGISLTLLPINIQNNLLEFEIMNYDASPKAVIIDQLDFDRPNEDFRNQVSKYLETAGYQVDIFINEEITVDLYKKLPSMNYKYIVIRTHALADGAVEKSASLLTGEKYNDHKYIKEQFLGQVGRGVPYLYSDIDELGGFASLEDNTFFTVGSALVDEQMIGNFPDSTIILAGCDTIKEKHLAESLLQRGASKVIGWSGLIDYKNNDSIFIHVLNKTLVNGVDIKQAVKSTNKLLDRSLDNPARLVYYSTDENEMSFSQGDFGLIDDKGPTSEKPGL